MHYIIVSIALFSLFTCGSSNGSLADQQKQDEQQLQNAELSKYSRAYFASGCFWCVEAIFESVKGVAEAVSGYAGGTSDSATYPKVSAGLTGHAETVEVYYDPQIVDYPTLLEVFFGSHDPTTLNRQGPDSGTQYRSAIFYQNDEEKAAAKEFIDKLQKDKVFNAPITTTLEPLDVFYPAEDYHQDFEKRNPDQPYVKSVSIPRLKRFKEKYPHLLKGAAND